MMRMSNIRMTTKVNREQLLETLQKNLENHKKMVEEAQAGYRKACIAKLQAKIDALSKGAVTSTHDCMMTPPSNYSSVYETVINMLKWNQDQQIELEADEFRQLVEDEWDWSSSFLGDASNYSATASEYNSRKYSHR